MTSPISALLPDLNLPHIRHNNIQAFIERLSKSKHIEIIHEGNSFEGRSIKRIRYGLGPIHILAWTQMHGDEATATAAVFDLIDILLNNGDSRLSDAHRLFTVNIVPMLNPDGAERCIRHTAQGIDMNRDAMAKQTPEGIILMRLVDELKPKVAFNLHDQSSYYQCGTSGNPSTIAFLAPAFDAEKSVNESRHLAMALIGAMHNAVNEHIPDCIARYDDTFSPRSFGDRISEKGAATILIESGAARNDPNRQIARKMNVVAMLEALNILKEQYQQRFDERRLERLAQAYWDIPENNSETLSSLVIRNLNFKSKHSYRASISIKQSARYSNQFYIDALGDLGIQAGLQEFDASELNYDRGVVHAINSPTVITNESYINWLKQGVIEFTGELENVVNQSDYPLLLNQPLLGEAHALKLHQPAYFLMRKGNKVIAALVNGQVIEFCD